ncbi:MAG: carboxypeptidase regulatory-like domain-containing protein [Actinobacteria bacterium]|nr:MAG: carboxypeptidase regulatory-like domain-containing protein [Actinomycetota bacterium]
MRRLAVLAAFPLLSACGGAQPASGGSGLQGTVSRGPITPACVQGKPCTEPARGVTLSFSKDGSVVARVKTSDDGTFRVNLPVGRYFVQGVQPVRPQHVSVSSGSFLRVDFSIDTKIR